MQQKMLLKDTDLKGIENLLDNKFSKYKNH